MAWRQHEASGAAGGALLTGAALVWVATTAAAAAAAAVAAAAAAAASAAAAPAAAMTARPGQRPRGAMPPLSPPPPPLGLRRSARPQGALPGPHDHRRLCRRGRPSRRLPPPYCRGGGVRVRPTGTAGVPINKGLRAGGAQRQWPLRRGCRRRRRCRCRVMRPPPLPAPRPSVALSRLRPQAMRRGRRAALASLAGRVCTAAAARPVGEPAAGREGEPGRGPRVWGLRPVVGDAP